MSHQIEWDNGEKTVVFQQYLKDATKKDLYELARKSAEMVSSVPHTVHLIIDERNIKLVLMGEDMKYLENLTPSNQGAVVMVVPETVLIYKTLIQDIGKRVAPHAFDQPFFVRSLEEARQFLADNFGVNYDIAPEQSEEDLTEDATNS